MTNNITNNYLRLLVISCFLFFTGCGVNSIPLTTTVKNVGENEIWVNDFKFGDKRLPVGVVFPGYPKSQLFYSSSIPKTAFFRWVTYDGLELEDTVEIKRPLPKRDVGGEYYIFFEVDDSVSVMVKTKPY